MLRLCVLGPLELRGAGASDSLLTQPKRLALLAYLVLAQPRGYHRRDTLVGLFWPELDQSAARNALSQALYVLRRALPDGVLVGRGDEEVMVDPERITSDVAEFGEAMAEGRWTDALAVYRGDFLAGFHAGDAPGFERWSDTERDRLREEAAGAAWNLAQEHIVAGEPVLAERAAQRALLLAPTDETPVRVFLEALAAAGDRAAALRFFEKFVTVLAEELEVEPAPETIQVAEAVRAGEVQGVRIASPVGRSFPSVLPGSSEGTAPPASGAESDGGSPTQGPTRSWAFRFAGPVVAAGALVATLVLASASDLGQADAATWFTADDWLVAADFEGPEDQPELALAFASLVIAEIERSGYAGVVGGLGAVSRTQLASALRRMSFPQDTPVTVEVALELAQREGAAGVLTGQVLPFGDAFVLRLQVLSCPGGHPVITATDEAELEHLASTAQRMARSVRRQLGESGAAIRRREPLPRVTTRSLEGLELYRRALNVALGSGGAFDLTRAIDLCEQALERDPDFAMAHAVLAAALLVRGHLTAGGRHAERAHELSAGLSRRERLHIEALYRRTVESDPRAAAALWDQMIHEFPDTRAFVLPYVAVARSWYGDWEGVLEASRELWRMRPQHRYASYNAWVAAWELGRPAVADTFLDRLHQFRRPAPLPDVVHAVYHRNWDEGERLCQTLGPSYLCANYYLMRGQLDRAADTYARVERARGGVIAEKAMVEHLRGDREAGRALLRRWGGVTADSLATPGFHVRRFLWCTVAAVMGVPDIPLACALEGEPRTSWDSLGSHILTRNAGAWSWRLLAVRALERGAVERAIRASEEAVALSFDEPSPWDDLIRGWTWEVRGRPDSAVVAYRAAVRPGNHVEQFVPTYLPWVLVRIGAVSEAAGDTANARDAYRSLLRMWEAADAEIQPLRETVRHRLAAMVGDND